MELELIEEAIPPIERAGGPGREPEKWETHLAGIKQSPGKSYRIFTYAKRTAATSRASSIRKRLWEATPEDAFELKVRPVPDSTPETFGVYVVFNGVRTAEDIAVETKRRADHAAARAAAGASQEAAVAAAPPVPAQSASSTQTAAQRVAAAKAKATAK